MTTAPVNFRPAATVLAPPGRVVQACEVIASLAADDRRSPPTPGALTGFLLSILTLGVWPAVVWPMRLREVAARQWHQAALVSAWLKPRVAKPDAERLEAAAAGVRPGIALGVLGWAGVAISLAAVVRGVAVRPAEQSVGEWLRGMTFVIGPASSAAQVVAFVGGAGGMVVAYVAHVVSVQLHARAVRRFLDAFNHVAVLTEALPPVYLEPIGWGFSFPWMLAAVGLVVLRQPWGVPLAIAGATDRRFRRSAWCKARQELAERVKAIVMHHPPAGRGGTPMEPEPDEVVSHCPRGGCGVPIVAKARFCPRCGTRVKAGVDRKA
ncbi:MAG TPA: zinc ribbon domain-containing protein [Humisphaera sp.]